MFKLSVSLCKSFSLLGCRKCSNEPGTSCSCKLFCCKLLLFVVFTEQINDDDDDDDDDEVPKVNTLML